MAHDWPSHGKWVERHSRMTQSMYRLKGTGNVELDTNRNFVKPAGEDCGRCTSSVIEPISVVSYPSDGYATTFRRYRGSLWRDDVRALQNLVGAECHDRAGARCGHGWYAPRKPE